MDAPPGHLHTPDERPRKRQKPYNGDARAEIPLHPDLQASQPPTGPMTGNSNASVGYPSNGEQQVQFGDYMHDTRSLANAETSAEYPRRRAMIACEVCRGRKTRCDGAKPKCRLCTELGAECVYREPGTKLDAGDKLILEHLQRIEGLLHDQLSGNGGVARVPRSSTMGSMLPSALNDDLDMDIGLSANISSRQTLFVALTQIPWAQHMLFAPLQDSEILAVENSRPKLAPARARDFGPEEIKSCVDAYFQYVHPYHGLINEERWQALYAIASLQYFATGIETATVLLVAAVGWNVLNVQKSLRPASEEDVGLQMFHVAWAMLPEIVTAGNALAIHCLVLGSTYLMSVFRPLDSWYTLGIASAKLSTARALEEGPGSAESETNSRLHWVIEQMRSDVCAAIGVGEHQDTPLQRPVGLPTKQPRNGDVGEGEDELAYVVAHIGLQRLMRRAGQMLPVFSPRTHNSTVDTLLALAENLNERLEMWYERMPEERKFQIGEPASNAVQSELRREFFSCRAAVFRPVVLEVMEDGGLLQETRVLNACKLCLEAAVRQMEGSVSLYARHLRSPWRATNDIVAETLFIMMATFSPGLASLLPPVDDVNRLVEQVINAIGGLTAMSPSLGLKIELLRSVQNQFGAKQQAR